MVEEMGERRLTDVPRSEILDMTFGCERVRKMEAGSIAKKNMFHDFKEIIPCLGQFYFQQSQKGRMKMVAMAVVLEYLKGEGWP